MMKIIQYFSRLYRYEVPTTDVNDPDHVIVPIYLREKKSSLSYSPSNLFGQPQLISVPKNNLTYENLYNHLLKRLHRYVNLPPDGQIWWKSNNNNNNANHINNNLNDSLMNGDAGKGSEDDVDKISAPDATSTVTSNGEGSEVSEGGVKAQVKFIMINKHIIEILQKKTFT